MYADNFISNVSEAIDQLVGQICTLVPIRAPEKLDLETEIIGCDPKEDRNRKFYFSPGEPRELFATCL